MAAIAVIAAVASTAISIDAQNKQAKAEVEAAENNYKAQANQADIKAAELSAQSAQASSSLRLDSLKERARVRVSQSEGGLSGLSLDRIYTLSDMREQANLENLATNESSAQLQNHMDLLSMRAQSQGQINTANSKITGTGMAALQIGAAGLGAYASSGGTFTGGGGDVGGGSGDLSFATGSVAKSNAITIPNNTAVGKVDTSSMFN